MLEETFCGSSGFKIPQKSGNFTQSFEAAQSKGDDVASAEEAQLADSGSSLMQKA